MSLEAETREDPFDPKAERLDDVVLPAVVLIFALGKPVSLRFNLPPGGLRIGRSEECEVHLADSLLSRVHAVVRFAEGRWIVRDNASRNGTYLDGVRIEGETSTDAARSALRLGDAVLLLETRSARFNRGMVGLEATEQGGFIAGPHMHLARGSIEHAARSGQSVLIVGETGTGKEHMARFFHSALGGRGPFVTVNCATIAQSLAEAMLFGAKKGSYSGATRDFPGHIVSADGGVLFLDELGELDLKVQAKLLRVLENCTVHALGAVEPQKVDVRFCAATHVNLAAAVEQKDFRADLFMRFSQAIVRLPPLRDRPEEIPYLLAHGLASRGDAQPRLNSWFVDACVRHAWPGNVRDLFNALNAARSAAERDGSRARDPGAWLLHPGDLPHLQAGAVVWPPTSHATSGAPPAKGAPPVLTESPVPLTNEQKEQILLDVYQKTGSASAAAKAARCSRQHVYNMLERRGIKLPKDRS